MRTITPIVFAVLVACSGADDRDARNRDADVAAISAILQEAAAAHRAGDAQRWAGLFTSDAVVLPEGEPPIVGTEPLRDWIAALYEIFEVDLSFEVVEIEIGNDWAWVRDRITGTFTPKAGGASLAVDQKGIVIFQRQPDGSWKPARGIFNSSRPLGGGA